MPASAASSETGDPLLLTPGPLTTSASVKQAMVHDWGSRDAGFIAINKMVLEKIVELAGAEGTHVTVPVQGSGTFAVEAMITTFVPKSGKLLVLINGAYGQRARGSPRSRAAPSPCTRRRKTRRRISRARGDAASDTAITHVFAVHCETTSGILNPIDEVARLVARHGRRLLVDSMSAFGALEIDARKVPYDALAASSNKCLEGVPGLGFVVCRKTALAECKGNATTLVLDLFDQAEGFARTGQYRFTPPIHVIVALGKAIEEHAAEGGVAGRGKRYRDNARVLIDGMRAMGFRTLLGEKLQAPIIITFHMPSDPKFVFQRFYDGLKDRGYVIYPGKLTVADSFRMGCIGRLYPKDMKGALDAVRDVLEDMRVSNGGPALAAE